MSGVEILETTEVVADYVPKLDAFLITFGAMIALFAAFGFVTCFWLKDWAHMIVCVVTGATMGIIAGLVVVFNYADPPHPYTQYKVTISDDVKMSEFLDRYEVIRQDGKI